MKDIADEVATLAECLHSMSNRVELAQMALEKGREDLAITACEDIFYSAQIILDEYCVKK